MSKLDNNTLSFSFEAVSLEAVLNPILTNNPTLNEAEILIDSSETLLWGDSLRIQQMIKNLVRFAYAQNQGDPVNLNVTGNGTDVVFQLSATQAQLSADQMDVLFDLYVEIDEAGRSELGIGGLDLPLTQKLAEQHQGQVWAESNERGLTFFLKLPQQQPD